jgi:hypothetical protein
MPGAIEPYQSRTPAFASRAVSRRTSRALGNVEHTTIVRMARVQTEAIVQTEKLHEIDGITREAMTGQAMLAKWRDTLAANDPFLADELRFFTDTARLAKGELIADLMTSYCREG